MCTFFVTDNDKFCNLEGIQTEQTENMVLRQNFSFPYIQG